MDAAGPNPVKSPGRRFLDRLPEGGDILTGIQAFCTTHAVCWGVFSLLGAVRSATLGILDQKQRVYVTWKEEGPFEILGCFGNVSLKDQEPFVHAKITLADAKKRVVGGHLLSETPLFYGELFLQEVEGPPAERCYDEPSGLFLWPLNRLETRFCET